MWWFPLPPGEVTKFTMNIKILNFSDKLNNFPASLAGAKPPPACEGCPPQSAPMGYIPIMARKNGTGDEG